MVTLVDSSVWIDLLHDRDTPQTDASVDLLDKEEVRTADLVLAEVLQGIRDDDAHAKALMLLTLPGVLVVSDHAVVVRAAVNDQTLRGRGITPRKTIGTLIATRCILDNIPLLYSDRDFDPFVRHLGLRSVLNAPGVN